MDPSIYDRYVRGHITFNQRHPFYTSHIPNNVSPMASPEGLRAIPWVNIPKNNHDLR